MVGSNEYYKENHKTEEVVFLARLFLVEKEIELNVSSPTRLLF